MKEEKRKNSITMDSLDFLVFHDLLWEKRERQMSVKYASLLFANQTTQIIVSARAFQVNRHVSLRRRKEELG